MEQVPASPAITAFIGTDGTAGFSVDGSQHPIHAASTEDARREIVRQAADIGRSLGHPVGVTVTEPDGTWPLVVHPDGAVEQGQAGPGSVSSPGGRTDVVADDADTRHPRRRRSAGPLVTGVPDHVVVPPRPPAPNGNDAPPEPRASTSFDLDPAGDAPAETDGALAPDSAAETLTGVAPTFDSAVPTPAPGSDTHSTPPAETSAPIPTEPVSPALKDDRSASAPAPRTFDDRPPAAMPAPSGPSAHAQESAPAPSMPAPHDPVSWRADEDDPPRTAAPAAGTFPADTTSPESAADDDDDDTDEAASPFQPASAASAFPAVPGETAPPAEPEAPSRRPGEVPSRSRCSFLTPERSEEPATKGMRGFLVKMGIRVSPNASERSERADQLAVSQHWPGPRTIAVVNGKGGAGKSLEVHEPVLTPGGYREIGTLQVGDTVIGRDGRPHAVLGVFPQGERALYRVSLTDGTQILADGDHLWEVQTEADRLDRRGLCSQPDCDRRVLARGLCSGHYKHAWRGRPFAPLRTGAYAKVERTAGGSRVMTTEQLLASGLGVDRPGRGTRRRYFLPVADPVQFETTHTPLDPYLLGLLLGDGGLSDKGLRFTTADAELVDAVAGTLPDGVRLQHKTGYDYTLPRTAAGGGNPLRALLVALGLAPSTSVTKFIPSGYKRGDIATRTALLQGLLDSDGHVERGVAAGFSTISDRLAEDVQFVAETLGCVVTRSRRETTYTHDGELRDGRPSHYLQIKPPAGLDLFRLERKRMQMHDGQRGPYRAIESIEPAGTGEAVCIAVDAPDHLFLTRNCVPTHNTPTTILTSAVFARSGGAGVLAWDNNQTRGTLGWRTEQGSHEATLHDLLPDATHLLSAGARAADLAQYVHHQRRDRYDVLRSKPMALADEQRVESDDVDRIHAVAAKYYRLIIMDSGNDESDPMWRRMIDHSDQIVVATTTRAEHAEAGALLLEALAARDERSARLAASAVTVVSQADPKASPTEVNSVAEGFRTLSRDVVTIPYDPAMGGGFLHYESLRPATRRAWLAATAAIARGLSQPRADGDRG